MNTAPQHSSSDRDASISTQVQSTATLDPVEVERFTRLASEWWDPNGKFRPLHQLGPARLLFIRNTLVRHFQKHGAELRPLRGLKILDVGCGGGLISEPLARLGAEVTGIDPSAETIAAAQSHALAHRLEIGYRAARIEDLVEENLKYDAVVCLEVIEHVPDVPTFLKTCAAALRPGGTIIVSTINRTMKSYALAIVAAEYILGWLPRGTHQWDRFVTPDELSRYLGEAGLVSPTFEGLTYDPLRDRWQLAAETSVNFMAAATKPVA